MAWRGRLVQCCTPFKSVHLRCSLLSLSRFKALGSPHSCSCSPCCVLVSPKISTPNNTETSFLSSSILYTSTVQPSPTGAPSANAALPPHHRFQTSYPYSAHPVPPLSAPSQPPLVSGCSLISSASSSSPDSPRVFQ